MKKRVTKLSFNKSTIANLNAQDLNNAKGGTNEPSGSCQTDEPWCPTQEIKCTVGPTCGYTLCIAICQ